MYVYVYIFIYIYICMWLEVSFCNLPLFGYFKITDYLLNSSCDSSVLFSCCPLSGRLTQSFPFVALH